MDSIFFNKIWLDCQKRGIEEYRFIAFKKLWLEGRIAKARRILKKPICGAKTRKGFSCINQGKLFANGRCKFHGGLSTGPKTIEGKQRIAEAQKIRWALYNKLKEKS